MESKKDHAEHKEHKSKTKLNTETVSFILASVLVIVLLFNAFNLGTLQSAMKDKIEKAQEAAILPKIALVSITNENCNNCFDLKQLVETMKPKMNVTSETSYSFDSTDAAALIKKYGIKKIPAAIFTGDIEKLGQEGFEKKEDALVLESAKPPYTDAETHAIVGRVMVTVIYDASCTE